MWPVEFNEPWAGEAVEPLAAEPEEGAARLLFWP
jgi:hypothetical protein